MTFGGPQGPVPSGIQAWCDTDNVPQGRSTRPWLPSAPPHPAPRQMIWILSRKSQPPPAPTTLPRRTGDPGRGGPAPRAVKNLRKARIKRQNWNTCLEQIKIQKRWVQLRQEPLKFVWYPFI